MGEGGGSGGGEEELESRTHVSLLMLPRCMVTTKRPGTGLTRLRPPGMTVQTPAAETEKARQTSGLGSSWRPFQTGVVERLRAS